MIVVVGGTGRLGRILADQFAAAGLPVRSVARHRPTTLPEGAAFSLADVRDLAALDRSLDGATVVVSAMSGMDPASSGNPESVDHRGNVHLVDAAVAHGADVVLVSTVGAAADSPLEIARAKWRAEQHLRASSASWTIVRCTPIAETMLDAIAQTARARGRPLVFGRGDNPVNFVAVSDVAAAVQRAVTDPSLRGHTIEVGGPRDLTLNELAAPLCRPGTTPAHLPRAVMRLLGTIARPVSPGLARMARMGLALDTLDLRFDPEASLAAYPWLSCTPLEAARV